MLFIFALLLAGLIILGIINNSAIKHPSLSFSKEWQGKFTEINGERIRYIQQGTGRDLLLIHGTPGSIEDWQPIIDRLSKLYRVTALDRYGNGFSTANNYTYTLDENVELSNLIINQLNLNDVVVVGHSFGGSTVTKLATQNNPKIKSFIIVSAPLYSLDLEFNFRLLSLPIIGKGLTILTSQTIASMFVKNGLKTTFGSNYHLVTDNFLDIRKKIWTQPKVAFATSNERKLCTKALQENSKLYSSIKKKITFLVGNEDRPSIIADFHSIKKEIPHAEFIFIDNCAHFVQFEHTNMLLGIMHEHLKK